MKLSRNEITAMMLELKLNPIELARVHLAVQLLTNTTGGDRAISSNAITESWALIHGLIRDLSLIELLPVARALLEGDVTEQNINDVVQILLQVAADGDQ